METIWSKRSGFHKETTEGGLCKNQKGDPLDREVLRDLGRSLRRPERLGGPEDEEVQRTKRSKGNPTKVILDWKEV